MPTAEEEEFLAECRQKDAAFPDVKIEYWAYLEHPLPGVTDAEPAS
ncbi:MAG: hypothetical protein SNJ61_06990 [Fimbriimonadaceae bacterium]